MRQAVPAEKLKENEDLKQVRRGKGLHVESWFGRFTTDWS